MTGAFSTSALTTGVTSAAFLSLAAAVDVLSFLLLFSGLEGLLVVCGVVLTGTGCIAVGACGSTGSVGGTAADTVLLPAITELAVVTFLLGELLRLFFLAGCSSVYVMPLSVFTVTGSPWDEGADGGAGLAEEEVLETSAALTLLPLASG